MPRNDRHRTPVTTRNARPALGRIARRLDCVLLRLLPAAVLALSASACSLVVAQRIDDPPNMDASVQDGTAADAGDATLPTPQLITWKNEPGDSEPEFIRSAELFSVQTEGFVTPVDVLVTSDAGDASALVSGIEPGQDGWITFQVPTMIPAGPVHVTLSDADHPTRQVSLPVEGKSLTLLRWLLGLSGPDLLFWTMDGPGHIASSNPMTIQHACGSAWSNGDPDWLRIGNWFATEQVGRWGFVGCPEKEQERISNDQTRAIYLPLLGTSSPALSHRWPGDDDTIYAPSFEFGTAMAKGGEQGINVLVPDSSNKIVAWHLTDETAGPSWNPVRLTIMGPNGQTDYDQFIQGGAVTPNGDIIVTTNDNDDNARVWFGRTDFATLWLDGEVTGVIPQGTHLWYAFFRQVPGRDNLMVGSLIVRSNQDSTMQILVTLMDAANNGQVLSQTPIGMNPATTIPIELIFSPTQPNLAVLLTTQNEGAGTLQVSVLRVDDDQISVVADSLPATTSAYQHVRAVWTQDGAAPALLVWGWWPSSNLQNPQDLRDNAFICRSSPLWACTRLTGGQVLWAAADPSQPGTFYLSTDEGMGNKKLRVCQASSLGSTITDCAELMTNANDPIQAIAVQP